MGQRIGDAAEVAMIELVDLNEIYGKGVGTTAVAEPAKKTRRSSVKKKAADTSSIEEATEVKTEDTATDTEPKAEA